MSVIVRYAPSPTGFLHVGHVRPALFNWLFARKHGGWFLLRIDDTDAERSSKEFEAAILEDLAWLGLKHTSFSRQSDRLEAYDAAAETLKAQGLLYPCYETPEELERKRKRQLARGQAPVYDRAALKLTGAERRALENEGRKPHWRFKLPAETMHWHDLIRGESTVDLRSVSDPVLIRSDGKYLYTLPSVVDDIFFAITHVIRGEDHATNTGPQLALFKALGAAPPSFAHHPRLVGADGGPLSKRLGSLGIRDLRARGFEPLAILSLFAKIGTSDPVEPALSLDDLARAFDLAKISRTPARFDEAELIGLNAKLLHKLSFSQVAERLSALGLPADERLWEAVHANLETLADLEDWRRVVEGPIAPVLADPGLTAKAAELLPAAFTDETWGSWTKNLSAATGAKGKALYHPLRLALTGRGDGPEMKKLLVLIGPERARARLLGRTA